jgi:divalent metal cation (Fe/Co/Zn/Cd) transporter
VAIDEPALRTADRPAALLRRGRVLEGVTLGWNTAGNVVLAVAAVAARSVALAGFGLDSLIEIGASAVVLRELSGSGEDRQRRALRLIGGAFVALAAYLTIQSVLLLVSGHRPGHSVLGTAWTGLTAVTMFALAAVKVRTGKALGNPVLTTEGRVTLVDGVLAVSVLAGPDACMQADPYRCGRQARGHRADRPDIAGRRRCRRTARGRRRRRNRSPGR